MIPSMFLLGLVVGRWYVVPAAAVAWPIILLLRDIELGRDNVAGAMALAAVNAAVGVFMRWGVRELARDVRDVWRGVRGPSES